MAPRFPERTFLRNWVKALLLSPGMLFPAAYLLVYIATNIYLNADYKMNLSRSINQATGNAWQISIKSLNPNPVLDSVTLHQIELTPIAQHERDGRYPDHHTITINTLEIPCPDLEKVLFSHDERVSSTKIICETILASKHLAQ